MRLRVESGTSGVSLALTKDPRSDALPAYDEVVREHGMDALRTRLCECGAADCTAIIEMTRAEQDRADHTEGCGPSVQGTSREVQEAGASSKRRTAT